MKSAQDAANSETKSTAGDKYDTARAMMHLEKDKLASQLSEASKLKKVLDELIISKKNNEVSLGSLVKTTKGLFFLSVSLGVVKIENLSCFVISPVSPIGNILLGKKEKDTFVFNNRESEIEEIY